MKASAIAYGGILLILIITSLVAVYIIGTAEPINRRVITIEGSLLSFADYADLVTKTFNTSIEFISQRAAYDLGSTGGVEGNQITTWNSTYPSIDLLGQQLENRIKENLPQGTNQNERTVIWGEGIVYVPVWNANTVLMGDVNNDGVVDMNDVNICEAALGSSPGDTRWNDACNLINDNKIDMRDIGVIARNNGQGEISKSFTIIGNKSFSIYDKSIDSKITLNYDISQTISSNYLKLLKAGRAILEDPNFNSKFDDVGALINALYVAESAGDTTFEGLDFKNKTISSDITEITIEEKCYDPSQASPKTYCLAPLKLGETGELPGVPYDYLKLNFLINAAAGSTPIQFFQDDFSEGNDNQWTRIKGSWTIYNGVYQQSDVFYSQPDTLDYLSIFGDSDWQNYILEADARNIENDSVSLVFRYTQDSSVSLGGEFYRVLLENGVAAVQYANGLDGAWVPHPGINGWESLNYISLNYDPYSWKHMKVEVNGPDIKFWVDGNLILTASDARLTSGRVGVLTNAKAQFDNVKVTLIS